MGCEIGGGADWGCFCAARDKLAARGFLAVGFEKGRSRLGGSIWFNWSTSWIADMVES